MNQQQLGITLLRVTFGVILFAHGYLLKVGTFTIAGTVGFFESLGLPAIVAYLTIGGEILAGLALIAGFLTRLAAWLTLPIMLGATWVHLGNGWLFSAPNGGWEFPALLAVMSVTVGLLGAGAFAMDNLKSVKANTPAALRLSAA